MKSLDEENGKFYLQNILLCIQIVIFFSVSLFILAKQIKPTSSLPNNKRGTKKISINLKNQNKITAGKNDDDTEDWLDDILK